METVKIHLQDDAHPWRHTTGFIIWVPFKGPKPLHRRVRVRFSSRLLSLSLSLSLAALRSDPPPLLRRIFASRDRSAVHIVCGRRSGDSWFDVRMLDMRWCGCRLSGRERGAVLQTNNQKKIAKELEREPGYHRSVVLSAFCIGAWHNGMAYYDSKSPLSRNLLLCHHLQVNMLKVCLSLCPWFSGFCKMWTLWNFFLLNPYLSRKCAWCRWC